MSNQLSLFEQINRAMLRYDGKKLLTTAQIKIDVSRKFGTNIASIIPSDY